MEKDHEAPTILWPRPSSSSIMNASKPENIAISPPKIRQSPPLPQKLPLVYPQTAHPQSIEKQQYSELAQPMQYPLAR